MDAFLIVLMVLGSGLTIWALTTYIVGHTDERRRTRESKEFANRLSNYLNWLGTAFVGPPLYVDGLRGIVGERAVHLANGLNAVQNHKYVEAIGHFRLCMGADSTDDEKIALAVLIGNCFASMSQLFEAQGHYSEATAVARHIFCWKGLVASLGALAEFHWQKMDVPKALETYAEALQLSRNMKDSFSEAVTLGKMAVIYRSEESQEKAGDYYRKARKMLEEIGAKRALEELNDQYERAQ